MKLSDTNESLELLVEQAKSIYHTRFNNLTHQTTKAGIIIAANGFAIGIISGVIKTAGINLSESLQGTCVILIIISILFSTIAIYHKNEVPILDIEAARKNIDILKNKKQFMDELINTYTAHIKQINKAYLAKESFNYVGLIFLLIVYIVIIVHVPSAKSTQKIKHAQTSIQQPTQF